MNYITIFTPTYNRAYILPKLYKTLTKQRIFNFEWLIIDDDSNDETEEVVACWMNEEKNFEIRYYKQKHGGKHRALNKAFDLAKYDFFFIVDSDDRLTCDATYWVNQWIDSIDGMDNIAGVAGNRMSSTGKVLGSKREYKKLEYIDASNLERGTYKLLGDKAEIYRTDILKKHKFPEFAGEYFVTENVCWNSIAAEGYKVRWYNKEIYVCDYLKDGLTNTGANSLKGHIDNYEGYVYYIKQCHHILSKADFVAYFLEYQKVASKKKIGIEQRSKELEMSTVQYIGYYMGTPCLILLRKLFTLKKRLLIKE